MMNLPGVVREKHQQCQRQDRKKKDEQIFAHAPPGKRNRRREGILYQDLEKMGNQTPQQQSNHDHSTSGNQVMQPWVRVKQGAEKREEVRKQPQKMFTLAANKAANPSFPSFVYMS
ncbi:MAG TPA: hypothetical protein VFV38_01380 [Ktedonobacteraceae bacterium]|nr:hypothetical protein [Ktedonobacteraceae bacterium]